MVELRGLDLFKRETDWKQIKLTEVHPRSLSWTYIPQNAILTQISRRHLNSGLFMVDDH